MKIFIDCDCILLQKTLEIFLNAHKTSFENADFIVSDTKKMYQKPFFLISKNSPYLDVPFSKDMLFSALEEYYFILTNKDVEYESYQVESLEDKIVKIFDKFRDELILTIKEYNGK